MLILRSLVKYLYCHRDYGGHLFLECIVKSLFIKVLLFFFKIIMFFLCDFHNGELDIILFFSAW